MINRLIAFAILLLASAFLLAMALAAWPPPTPPQRINFNQFLDDEIFIVYDLVMSKEYLTPDQAAERFDVTGKTIRRWIHLGYFPNAYQLSTAKRSPYRIPMDDIDAFDAARQVHIEIKQK